jgi:hypothetical protein
MSMSIRSARFFLLTNVVLSLLKTMKQLSKCWGSPYLLVTPMFSKETKAWQVFIWLSQARYQSWGHQQLLPGSETETEPVTVPSQLHMNLEKETRGVHEPLTTDLKRLKFAGLECRARLLLWAVSLQGLKAQEARRHMFMSLTCHDRPSHPVVLLESKAIQRMAGRTRHGHIPSVLNWILMCR